MQTVVTDVLVGSREMLRVYQRLQHRRPRRMSEIEVQRCQHACKKGYRTYVNRTEEIQLSQRTTYRVQEREAVGLVINRNTERGESVAREAVRMREMGDKAREKIQGHIYPTSNLGMREDVYPPVLEPERGINNIYDTRIAGNEGWNPQGPGPPTRWMAEEAASMTHGCAIVT